MKVGRQESEKLPMVDIFLGCITACWWISAAEPMFDDMAPWPGSWVSRSKVWRQSLPRWRGHPLWLSGRCFGRQASLCQLHDETLHVGGYFAKEKYIFILILYWFSIKFDLILSLNYILCINFLIVLVGAMAPASPPPPIPPMFLKAFLRDPKIAKAIY